jgi:type IV pilus assembly protein PilV
MEIMSGKVEQRGLTLLEVLVALAIFAFGMLGIAGLQAASMRGNATSIKMTTAVQLASQRVEELLNTAYDDDDLADAQDDGAGGLDNDTQTSADHSELGVQAGDVGRTYDLFWNVVDDSPMDNVKTIRVIVAWQDQERTKRVALNAIKRR